MILNKDDFDQIGLLSRDRIGVETLERYSGSAISEFQPYILLTNFSKYTSFFSNEFNVEIKQGSVMNACHSPENQLSFIHFGIGSPLAALVMELLSFVKPKAILFLGLCGGLRGNYEIGDYFNPVAAIRAEGTSDLFMPERCPALSSFVIQRKVCEELERNKLKIHSGVIHTTNLRFWEFNEDFKRTLEKEQVQAIDMECATLFAVGFACKIAIGALLLISDLPLHHKIKTKEIQREIFENHAQKQIKMGINILKNIHEEQSYTKYQF